MVNPQKFLLKDLANVHAGYLIRTKMNHDLKGNISILQIRDTEKDLSINYDKAIRTHIEKVPEKYLVSKGDILFKIRSTRSYDAYLIDENLSDTIASAHFFIIRPKDGRITPEFLAWYINQPPAQSYFKLLAKGTYLPAVTLDPLSNLEVPVLPLDTQKKLVQLDHLLSKHIELNEQLQNNLKKLTWDASMKSLEMTSS